MGAATLALCLLLAPPTLGDALRAIGAFDGRVAAEAGVEPSDPPGAEPSAAPTAEAPAAAVDPRLVPPPPPDRIWPELVIATGVAMVVTGVVGLVASGGCATRDGGGRCLEARGSHPAWPALVVVGLGTTVTGNYWARWTRLDDLPAP